jgi:hypothetical protein
MKNLGNLLKKISLKKIARKLFLAAVALHSATQISYSVNDIARDINPSQLRQEFYTEFGFPIRGWKQDIEENGKKVSNISEELHRQMADSPLNMYYLRIGSQNYLKKSFFNQAATIFTLDGNTNGYSRLPFKIIELTGGDYLGGEACHEIKHEKIFKVLKRHPEFLEKWKRLAIDKNGNSYYRHFSDEFLRSLRIVNRAFKELSPEEALELGFVSDYSMTSPLEDLAETSRFVEKNPLFMGDKVYGRKNNKITEKIKLLEEVSLVPKGALEFLRLNYIRRNIKPDSNAAYTPKAFLDQSSEFLIKYPGTVFECDLRNSRAWFLEQRWMEVDYTKKGWKEERRKILLETADEYLRALNSTHKDFISYYSSVEGLSKIYWLLNDGNKKTIFSGAVAELNRRYASGTPSLARLGVNDYLDSCGIVLDPHEERNLTTICGGNGNGK